MIVPVAAIPGISYNTALVLSGTGLLGMAAGVIGSFAVLRRRALLGDALAHAALPGICLAFLIVGARSFPALLAGAFVTSILGMTAISFISAHTRTRDDAAIGIVLSVFFGAGVVLLTIIQNFSVAGSRAGLKSFIFGKTAGMIASDVHAITILVVIVLATVVLFYKEFKLVSFDPGFASVQGWPVGRLDYLILGLLTVTIVIGLPAVGVVLMAAMIILPGAAARFWTDRLGILLILSGLFGLVAGTTGTLISSGVHAANLPAGPTIVLVGSMIFVTSVTLAPGRGVVARFLRRRRITGRMARHHVLRGAYEIIEPHLPDERSFDLGDLARRRGWPLTMAHRAVARAERSGDVAPGLEPGRWRLTEKGFHEAARVVRRHRLWELYLIHYADVASDHVDRDADMVEHVLPPELVEELEGQLRRSGELPLQGELPLSPHAIGEDAHE